MSIVVKTQLKEIAGDYKLSAGFLESLDEKVRKVIEEAKIRAEANHRKTLMKQDI